MYRATAPSTPSPGDQVNRRFAVGLLLSLFAHALLLSLQFGVPGGAGTVARLFVRLAPPAPSVALPEPAFGAGVVETETGPAVVPDLPVPPVKGMHLAGPAPAPPPPAVPARRRQLAQRRAPVPKQKPAATLTERVIAEEDKTDPTFTVPQPEPTLRTGDALAAQEGTEQGTGSAASTALVDEAEVKERQRLDEQRAKLAQEEARREAEQQAQLADEKKVEDARQEQMRLAEQERARQQEIERAAAQDLARQKAAESSRVLEQQRLAQEQARAAAVQERLAQQREAETQRQREADDAARMALQRDDELRRQRQAEDQARLAQQREAEARRRADEEARLAQQRDDELRRQRQAEDQARLAQQREAEARKRADEEARLAQLREEESRRRQADDELPLAQQRAEAQRLQREADELAARQRADEERRQAALRQRAAEQRAAEELAQRQAAERTAAQESAQRRADELAAQQNQRLVQREPGGAAGTAGQGAAIPGAGGGGKLPGNVLGSDLGNRAREMLRGLELGGTPPPLPSAGQEPQPARRLVSTGAEHDAPLRLYIDGFRQKIERNGTLNGAQLSRERVRVDPVVSVAIGSDGSVLEVLIVRSSGHAELDAAVRRIVRVNARYAVFPPNVAARYDVIEIRRIWTFAEGLRLLEEVR
jgi:TonB family protein